MAENRYAALLCISFLPVAGVIIQFLWGWAADRPEVTADALLEIAEEPDPGPLREAGSLLYALAMIGGVFLSIAALFAGGGVLFGWGDSEKEDSDPEKSAKAKSAPQRTAKVIRLDQRRLLTVKGGLRDRILAGPGAVRGDLVTMSGYLCAFGDGTKVHYNRREMLRTADLADIGQGYWFMLAGLAILIDALLPGVRERLGEWLPAFEAYPWLRWIGPQMALYVFLSAVLWFVVRGARSRVLTARVEKAANPLMAAGNTSLPEYSEGPVPLAAPEISSSEAAALAGLVCFSLFTIYQAFLLNLFLN